MKKDVSAKMIERLVVDLGSKRASLRSFVKALGEQGFDDGKYIHGLEVQEASLEYVQGRLEGILYRGEDSLGSVMMHGPEKIVDSQGSAEYTV